MADTLLKISQLEEATTAPDASYIPIDDGNLTKKITVGHFNATSTASAASYAAQAAEDRGLAHDYMTTAASMASNASSYKDQANAAKVAAQTAQTLAEAAQGAAEGAAAQAANTAQTMSGYAASLAGYVAEAEADANRAEAAATLASSYVSTVEADVGDVIDAVRQTEESASEARTNSYNSEAYAVGKRNGVDVSSGDVAYHNNSKYYAEHAESVVTDIEHYVTDAEGYANSALQSKNTAQQMSGNATEKALDSEAWAVGKRNNVDVGSTDATYHNNSKYYSQQAHSAATEAAADAESAQSTLASISALLELPEFTVDFSTGELKYTMDNAYSFNINTTTGNLEWEVVA